jgi:hypothetical protein
MAVVRYLFVCLFVCLFVLFLFTRVTCQHMHFIYSEKASAFQ